MNEIRLSGAKWVNPDSFWDDFLAALQVPDWHGRNLDALNDSICAGSINKVEAPFRILIRNAGDLPKSVVFLLVRINALTDEWKSDGTVVELCFEGASPPGWDYVRRPDGFLHMRVLELLREWDPIGVYGPGSNCPDNEYDSYAMGVIGLLKRGKNAREVAKHLSSLAEDSMGLSGVSARRNLAIANQLVAALRLR